MIGSLLFAALGSTSLTPMQSVKLHQDIAEAVLPAIACEHDYLPQKRAALATQYSLARELREADALSYARRASLEERMASSIKSLEAIDLQIKTVCDLDGAQEKAQAILTEFDPEVAAIDIQRVALNLVYGFKQSHALLVGVGDNQFVRPVAPPPSPRPPPSPPPSRGNQ